MEVRSFGRGTQLLPDTYGPCYLIEHGGIHSEVCLAAIMEKTTPLRLPPPSRYTEHWQPVVARPSEEPRPPPLSIPIGSHDGEGINTTG